MSALENLPAYPSRDEIFLAAIEDGYTPAAAEAYARELDGILQDEWDAQQQGEIDAENAWLIHAENAGWQETELERDYEDSLGVVPFSEAYAQSMVGTLEGDRLAAEAARTVTADLMDAKCSTHGQFTDPYCYRCVEASRWKQNHVQA